MSGLAEQVSPEIATGDSAEDTAAPRPVLIHSCNRLGRVANPPGFSLSDWFRSARRR
jgi:hypothetical protein